MLLAKNFLNFMDILAFGILAILKNCQNGTFEPIPKRGFSKKAHMGIEKLFLFQDRMNPLNTWKGKLEVASFLPSKNLYRQCVMLFSEQNMSQQKKIVQQYKHNRTLRLGPHPYCWARVRTTLSLGHQCKVNIILNCRQL